jgi:hypothetical protein
MPSNATAPIVTRVLVERLVDDLDELEHIAWNTGDLDRLRELAGEAMQLATVLLDG